MYTEVEFSAHRWPAGGWCCRLSRHAPPVLAASSPCSPSAHCAPRRRTPGMISPASRNRATPVEGPRGGRVRVRSHSVRRLFKAPAQAQVAPRTRCTRAMVALLSYASAAVSAEVDFAAPPSPPHTHHDGRLIANHTGQAGLILDFAVVPAAATFTAAALPVAEVAAASAAPPAAAAAAAVPAAEAPLPPSRSALPDMSSLSFSDGALAALATAVPSQPLVSTAACPNCGHFVKSSQQPLVGITRARQPRPPYTRCCMSVPGMLARLTVCLS